MSHKVRHEAAASLARVRATDKARGKARRKAAQSKPSNAPCNEATLACMEETLFPGITASRKKARKARGLHTLATRRIGG